MERSEADSLQAHDGDASASRSEAEVRQEKAKRSVVECGATVIDVHQGEGATSKSGSVPEKTRGDPKHLDLVSEDALRLQHRGLLGALVVLATLASVIVSAAVAAAVATSLSATEEAGTVLAPSIHYDAVDLSLDKRRLDSEGASGNGNGIDNASELVSVAAASELEERDDAGRIDRLCLDATKGEVCHRLVVWAMEDGLRLYPRSFTGLTRASPFHAFQQAMHQRNPELCPLPCPQEAPPLAHPAALGLPVSVRGSCNYGHIDSAPAHAGCFIVHHGRLLTEKLTYDGMRYDIPGGQTDWHEPARCTAHREALEETGYNVAPRELLAVVRNNFHIYRCELLQANPIRGHDHEISWVGWMYPDEVREKVRRHMFRFPEAARYADWMR